MLGCVHRNRFAPFPGRSDRLPNHRLNLSDRTLLRNWNQDSPPLWCARLGKRFRLEWTWLPIPSKVHLDSIDPRCFPLLLNLRRRRRILVRNPPSRNLNLQCLQQRLSRFFGHPRLLRLILVRPKPRVVIRLLSAQFHFWHRVLV